MYEIHDLAGDRVETGYGLTVFESSLEAVKEAMDLGRAAIERMESMTSAPTL